MAIHLDPKNKGKFTATKKKSGKSTAQLKHSKNALTRKRAVFAQNAKKWGKNRKKELSAKLDELIELASPLMKGVKSIGTSPLGLKLTKQRNMAKKIKKQGGMVPGDCPGSSSMLSTRLDELIQLGSDPRPRNNLGEFSGQQEGVADPTSMAKTYQNRAVSVGTGIGGSLGAATVGGAGGAIGGGVVKSVGKALLEKIKTSRLRKG